MYGKDVTTTQYANWTMPWRTRKRRKQSTSLVLRSVVRLYESVRVASEDESVGAGEDEDEDEEGARAVVLPSLAG